MQRAIPQRSPDESTATEDSAYSGAADLERLTALIRDATAALERRKPGCFQYHGVSLRGAVERQLFIECVLDRLSLAPLERGLHSAGVSESSFDYGRFRAWLSESEAAGTRADGWREIAKALARLCVRNWMAPAPGSARARSEPGVELIFCAIDKRFVAFFKPLIDFLGTERCALLCIGDAEIEKQATRRGLRVVRQYSSRLMPWRLKGPPAACFPPYSVAVRLLLTGLGTLSVYRPKTVVFAEAASCQEEAIARAARALSIPTVRVQYGRAGVIHPGYYDMPYDKMLMWGDGFVERLRACSPKSRYVVTGSPLFRDDPSASSSGGIEAFAAGTGLVTFISQPECKNISRTDYEALVRVAEDLAQTTADLSFLVRLHPADKAKDFHALAARWPARIKVSQAGDFPLAAVLKASRLVVGLYSTVLSEAAAYGVLPVVLRLGERHRIFPAPEDEGAAALASAPAEAVSLIRLLALDSSARAAYADKMSRFASRYFGNRDGRALERIAQHIQNPLL